MAKLEVEIENRCVGITEAAGWLNVKLDLAKKSWPDRQFFGPGETSFMVEFKRPKEKPTVKQAQTHADLRALGHKVYVIDSVTDFQTLFDGYCRYLLE